ncbi:hypothetical protein [Achromobacter denitrificans]|uniref:hypothetical protein n=1 Tax=Achromobacter denitrificans TaxID=32002 RepID=UPI00242CBAE1|nr:hypothetical protein [Achromobacter denitrificans]MBV2160533.1 hypothetical protein [Achromobacter denitrificans]
MFAQFRDQEHPWPALVIQGPCDIEVIPHPEDDLAAVEMVVMTAPRGLTGPWCGVSLSLTVQEAEWQAAELERCIKIVRQEADHGA